MLSGSPLFVSSKKGVALPEAVEELKRAFDVASRRSYSAGQPILLEPLDWQHTICPMHWQCKSELAPGRIVDFRWYDENGVSISEP